MFKPYQNRSTDYDRTRDYMYDPDHPGAWGTPSSTGQLNEHRYIRAWLDDRVARLSQQKATLLYNLRMFQNLYRSMKNCNKTQIDKHASRNLAVCEVIFVLFFTLRRAYKKHAVTADLRVIFFLFSQGIIV